MEAGAPEDQPQKPSSSSSSSENISRPHSRSRSSRRSPNPPLSASSGTGKGIILNRSLTPKSNEANVMAAAHPVYVPSSKMMLSTRRSSSGIFISSMFGSRFRHLQKLHTDAFGLGLNAVCMPGLPLGTMFRSSLPATPVSTPIHTQFHHFTEQAIRERLCRTPSPRKNSRFSPLQLSATYERPSMGLNSLNMSMSSNSEAKTTTTTMDTSGGGDIPPLPPCQFPMELTTPTSPIPETLMEAQESDGGSPNDESQSSPTTPLTTSNNNTQKPPMVPSNASRKLFVGNISYRITKSDLYQFFREFGRLEDAVLVYDHIKKHSKGYGFVTFWEEEDARKVLEADSNSLILDGRQLRINLAEPKAMKTMRKEIYVKMREKKEEEEQIDQELTEGILHSPTVLTYEKQANDLNEDLLLLVFDRIENIIDKTQCELVCKRWRDIVLKSWSAQKSLVFEPTFYSFGAPALTTTVLCSILKKCPNLTHIDLNNVSNCLDSKAFELIAHCCPSLEHINLTKGQITGYGLKVLSEKCKCLKVAILNECYSFNEKDLWYFLQNTRETLTHLEIDENRKVSGKCFRVMSTKVKRLSIRGCERIRKGGFDELTKTCGTNLEVLVTNQLSQDTFDLIYNELRGLTQLTITGSIGDPLVRFSCLHKLNQLRVLIVESNFEDCNDVSVITVLSHCEKLHRLEIHFAGQLTDETVNVIPAKCPAIKTLVLKSCKITDAGLLVLSNLSHLKRLDISGSEVTDSAVKFLLMNNDLSYLNVNDCSSVTIESLLYAFDLWQKTHKKVTISYDKKRFVPSCFKNTTQIVSLFEEDEDEDIHADLPESNPEYESDDDQQYQFDDDPLEEYERNNMS